MTVLVTGSAAFDFIYKHPGVFGEALEQSDLNNVSLSFFSTEYSEQDGGCAVNIAYNLALLGIPHDVAALIGSDGQHYLDRMRAKGINTEHFQRSQLPTARCTLFTDSTGAQINAFYPGAMVEHYHRPLDMERYSLVIVSPNNPDQMEHWVELAFHSSVPVVFDPGQAIHGLSPQQLDFGFSKAFAVIMNRAEHEKSCEMLGYDIIENGTLPEAKSNWVIITDGAAGSYVFFKGEQVAAIPAHPVSEAVDPTGAGDAYRAGLIHGILTDQLVNGCQIGSILAATKVENQGGQNHTLPASIQI